MSRPVACQTANAVGVAMGEGLAREISIALANDYDDGERLAGSAAA
jgi:hypothetical protein